MDRPSAADVRAWAPPLFAWADYGFPAPDPPTDPDALDVRVGWAVGTLYAVTGRTLESITLGEEEQIAQRVIAAFVMLEATGGSAAALAVLEQPWLKSFTAGSYSETRFSPSELAGSSGKTAPPYPPTLWALLWALMTDEKRDEWNERLTGQVRPAAGFFDMDWDAVGVAPPPTAWGAGVDPYPWG